MTLNPRPFFAEEGVECETGAAAKAGDEAVPGICAGDLSGCLLIVEEQPPGLFGKRFQQLRFQLGQTPGGFSEGAAEGG